MLPRNASENDQPASDEDEREKHTVVKTIDALDEALGTRDSAHMGGNVTHEALQESVDFANRVAGGWLRKCAESTVCLLQVGLQLLLDLRQARGYIVSGNDDAR
jgi:hypothetical protein